jgi:histidinol dehydrogenase
MWFEIDDRVRRVEDSSPPPFGDSSMPTVWVLYAVVVLASVGLYVGVGPTRLLIVVAMTALVAAVVQLVRAAMRP